MLPIRQGLAVAATSAATDGILHTPVEVDVKDRAMEYTPVAEWGIFNPYGSSVWRLTLGGPGDGRFVIIRERVRPGHTEFALLAYFPDLRSASESFDATLVTLFDRASANQLLGEGLPTYALLPEDSPIGGRLLSECFFEACPQSRDHRLEHFLSMFEEYPDPVARCIAEERAATTDYLFSQRRSGLEALSDDTFLGWWDTISDEEHAAAELDAIAHHRTVSERLAADVTARTRAWPKDMFDVAKNMLILAIPELRDDDSLLRAALVAHSDGRTTYLTWANALATYEEPRTTR